MLNSLPRLSSEAFMALFGCLLAFALLPLKLVILLAAVYWIASTVGAFKLAFPDVWEDPNADGMADKPYQTFLDRPLKISGKWYVFRYVGKVTVNGTTSYYFGDAPKSDESDGTDFQ